MGAAESLSLRRYGASPGSHSHDHFQILLGLSGALDLEVAGHGVRVAPADALPLAHYLASALQQGRPLAQTHGPALLLEAWLAGSAPHTSLHRSTRQRTIDWPALQRWAALQWHRELSVADLAAQVHLSPSQFAARCREDQGMGAMAWLRGQRLAQARLLRGTGMAVAEVARRTGYRSPSALTAALRRAEDH